MRGWEENKSASQASKEPGPTRRPCAGTEEAQRACPGGLCRRWAVLGSLRLTSFLPWCFFPGPISRPALQASRPDGLAAQSPTRGGASSLPASLSSGCRHRDSSGSSGQNPLETPSHSWDSSGQQDTTLWVSPQCAGVPWVTRVGRGHLGSPRVGQGRLGLAGVTWGHPGLAGVSQGCLGSPRVARGHLGLARVA